MLEIIAAPREKLTTSEEMVSGYSLADEVFRSRCSASSTPWAVFAGPVPMYGDLISPMALSAIVPGLPGAAAINVDRACTELRRGRPLAIATDEGWLLAAAIDTLSEALLQWLLQTGASPQLLLSPERLCALGSPAVLTPHTLAFPAGVTLVQLQQLAAVSPDLGDCALEGAATATGESQVWTAALMLCKRSRLVPALLLVHCGAGANAALTAAHVLQVDPTDVTRASSHRFAGLYRVSDARLPLTAEDDCTMVLFREVGGDAEHVAVIVGQPPTDSPVPVRLHSACLTGDLMGSLRCDCGPQLQQAVARLAETGGVLLYLPQEGRSTGLANKLRAYRLQDAGLDTLQADRHRGFREDERDFTPAAAMLRMLGYTRIHLLTNNPQKIEALRQNGIDVVDRKPLHAQVNVYNERYIRTKQQAGHLGVDD